MLSKCVQCGFNIRQNEEFCLNCGLKEPTKDSPQMPIQKHIPLLKLLKSFRFRLLLGVVIGILFFVITGLFRFGFNFSKLFDTHMIVYLIHLFAGITNSFVISNAIRKVLIVKTPRKKVRQPTKNSLNGKAKTISHRIFELESRRQKINELVLQIGELASGKLADTRKKLLIASEVIANQLSKYKLQKHKIELVRLQNQVLPYITNFYSLDEFKTEDAVIVCEQTIREVGKIRQNLAKNFPNKDDYEFGNFMQNLDETSNSCEKLWEALLNKQAVFALKDVQPLEKADIFSQTNELAHTIETFNIESTLTDFSESFDQLETEYKRLLADNEVSQKLLNYEN